MSSATLRPSSMDPLLKSAPTKKGGSLKSIKAFLNLQTPPRRSGHAVICYIKKLFRLTLQAGRWNRNYQKKRRTESPPFLDRAPDSDETNQAQNTNTTGRARGLAGFGPQPTVATGVGAGTSTLALAESTRLSEPKTIRMVSNGVKMKQRAK